MFQTFQRQSVSVNHPYWIETLIETEFLKYLCCGANWTRFCQDHVCVFFPFSEVIVIFLKTGTSTTYLEICKQTNQ